MRGAALCLLALTACYRPVQVVTAPVAVPCPEPPALAWPPLPVDAIGPGTSASAVVQAYVVSLSILRGRLAEALALLNGYRTTTPTTQIPGGRP